MSSIEYTINMVGSKAWYLHEYPDGRIRGEMKTPKGFDVVYDKKKDNIISFFINDAIRESEYYDSAVKIAYISENRPVLNTLPAHRNNYIFLENNHNNFDYIATYDGQLIENFLDKCLVAPYCTTFIWPEERQKIYAKRRLCSYITSTKIGTEQQRFRVRLLHKFRSQNIKDRPDLYGRGHNPMPESRLGKYTALKDYAFSINIENMVDNHYFSEKIIDCFLCGTIPIYFGAKKINDYFNPNGIISFDKEEELRFILENISFELYKEKIDAIRENYFLAKKYTDTISYLFEKDLKKIYDEKI